MSNNTAKDLVAAFAMNGSVSETQATFDRLMAEKVNAALDERKVAVASQIYNTAVRQD